MIKHRPDIDGLRALAVLPVVLFHAHLKFSGGFVGVDIFFVISGFLITSIILREIGEGNFSLVTFWERRIRRILPALIVVVLATLAAAWFLYLPEDFSSVAESVLAQSVLMSNVFFFRHTGYFEAPIDTMPLLHTWSLAVEEQFYLLFPLLLMFLARYKRVSTSRCIAGLGIGSFALSVVGTYYAPSATFYLLPTRAWELMIGAFLAANPGRQLSSPGQREAAGLSGAVLILFSIFFYTDKTRFPGLAAVPPCLGAALIIFSGGPKPTLIGRVLGLKPVVFIGLISYSLYLWHWPFLVFSKYGSVEPQSRWLCVGALTASFVPAILSWKFVETPFRKRLICPRRPQVFAFAGCSMLLLAILGRGVYLSQGMPSRLPAQALGYADGRHDFAFRNETTPEQAAAGQFSELGGQGTNQPIEVLLWGDSHAEAVASALDELCRRYSVRGVQATHAATAPLLGYVSKGPSSLKENSPAFSQSIVNFIAQRHVKAVVLAAFWTTYRPTDSLNDSLVSTIRAVTASGATIYVVKDVPISRFDVPRLAALTALHRGDFRKLAGSPDEYLAANRAFGPDIDRISKMGAVVLDTPGYLLNRDGLFDVVRDDRVLYYDSQHLSVGGAKLLEPMFEPIFRQIKPGIVDAPARADGIKNSQETVSSHAGVQN